MKKILILLFLLCFGFSSKAQTYFPPLTGSTWQTTDPSSLGWCQDSITALYNYLEGTNSKAFIILKDGKIVLEKYFGTFTIDSFHVWNSAGKTLTGYAVGIAQEEGFLNINDPSSMYLGSGWTSETTLQEQAITIKNQLTMTSGLDDGVPDMFCTDPSCLQYIAAPNTRWAYHNAPYTLLDSVLFYATGYTINQYVQQKIGNKIGMVGIYIQSGYNNIYVSKPRSMARFGLLLSQNGIWNGTTVCGDLAYLNAMHTPSQTINNSYGYLTWLNGQSSYMIPQSQFVFPGSALPNAPADLYAALGKNGQIINVVPSQNMVVVRMGEDDGNSLVSTQYNDTIWQYINRLPCALNVSDYEQNRVSISPNPSNQCFSISGIELQDEISIHDQLGRIVSFERSGNTITPDTFIPGMYLVTINKNKQMVHLRLILN